MSQVSHCDVCRATGVEIRVYADAGIPHSSGYCNDCTTKGAISEWNVVMVAEKVARMLKQPLVSVCEGFGREEMAARLAMGSVKNALVFDMVTSAYIPAKDWWLKYSHQIAKYCTKSRDISLWLRDRNDNPQSYATE